MALDGTASTQHVHVNWSNAASGSSPEGVLAPTLQMKNGDSSHTVVPQMRASPGISSKASSQAPSRPSESAPRGGVGNVRLDRGSRWFQVKPVCQGSSPQGLRSRGPEDARPQHVVGGRLCRGLRGHCRGRLRRRHTLLDDCLPYYPESLWDPAVVSWTVGSRQGFLCPRDFVLALAQSAVGCPAPLLSLSLRTPSLP